MYETLSSQRTSRSFGCSFRVLAEEIGRSACGLLVLMDAARSEGKHTAVRTRHDETVLNLTPPQVGDIKRLNQPEQPRLEVGVVGNPTGRWHRVPR